MTGRWHTIVISAFLGITLAVFGWGNWMVIILLFLVYYSFLQRRQFKKYTMLFSITLLFFYLYAHFYDNYNKTSLTDQSTLFYGKIISLPIIDGDRLAFQFQTLNGEKLQVNYFIKSKEEQQHLSTLLIGMECYLDGELRKPMSATNFYAFDYHQYLYFQKIHWVLVPKVINVNSCINKNSNGILLTIKRYRQQGISFINHSFPEGSKGIVAALVFGFRAMMDDNLLDAYQTLGVVHLLAVSGLHVGLIVSSLFYLLLRMGLTRERTLESLFMFLPIYVLLAGGAPSVIRAAAMAMILLILLRYSKKIHPLDGISFVCIVYLLISPYALFELGFQLSFLVSYALILSSKTIFSLHSAYFVRLLLVTIISQLVAMPLLLYHFFELSWLSVPLNLLYIPYVSLFLLPLCFFMLFISFVFPFFSFILQPFHVMIDVVHSILLHLQSLSWGTVTIGKPAIWNVLLLYVVIIFGCYTYERRGRITSLGKPFATMVIVASLPIITSYISSSGEIVFLDVGQGDSIYIELPYRRGIYLIDTGGVLSFGREEEWRKRRKEFDVGRDVLVPYLKAKGVTNINKLILTHGHYDHIGGALELAKQIRIEKVLYSIGEVTGAFEQELLLFLRQQGSKIIFVKEGDRWEQGNDYFYILSPKGNELSLNNRSIVIYARLGGLNWLFTGDLEEEGEYRIINEYPTLPVDILKVGHHGSRTSTTSKFLEHLQPKAAVVSNGRNNRFGHPHPEVVQLLLENHIPLFRTDQHGAIRFELGKKGNKVSTKLENEKELPR